MSSTKASKAEKAAYQRDWHNGHSDEWKQNRARQDKFRRHGITEEIFRERLEAQGNACAVCRLPDPTAIDHDHAHCSGRWGCGVCFRGILCGQCNMALGLFRDSPIILQGALTYLDGGKAV